MADSNSSPRRLCPTRPDGAHALIAHWITPSVCLERQRKHYHKCFSCQYRGLAADVLLPDGMRPEPVPEPVNGKAAATAKKKSASTPKPKTRAAAG